MGRFGWILAGAGVLAVGGALWFGLGGGSMVSSGGRLNFIRFQGLPSAEDTTLLWIIGPRDGAVVSPEVAAWVREHPQYTVVAAAQPDSVPTIGRGVFASAPVDGLEYPAAGGVYLSDDATPAMMIAALESVSGGGS